MVLDWLGKGRAEGAATVADLLSKKQFAKAVELAQAEQRQRPRDMRGRVQLADALVAAGRGSEAVPLLRGVADELAADGFAAKSIALLKRIQKIEPGQAREVDERLATLIEQRSSQTVHPGFGRGGPSVSPEPALGMEEIGFEPDAGPPLPPPLTTPLFPHFSKDELLLVMRGLELHTFAAGDIVVAEGEAGHSLFIITSGAVKAWMKDAGGHYNKVRRLADGDFFGEISVLTGRARTATVTAATACELLELDRETLDGITATHPHVRTVLQQFYDERTRTEARTTKEGPVP